ncbi:MAG: hypothetical protein CMM10_01575 [Rhodospirillaceae bacterium]|nr:hypothetical protein [Rhodospirillaceae bacterium]
MRNQERTNLSVEQRYKKPEPEDRTEQAKTRSCLRCGENFESRWHGERICKKCKSTNDWRQG